MSDSALPSPAPLVIDFIADVVCPWCYVGWRRLEKALALRPDVAVEVRWRPFQLDPTLPEEGVDRATYYAERFPDPARARAIGEALRATAAEDGLDLRLRDIPKSPNTNAAHRLIRWAGEAGVQAAAAEAVMRAYFTQLRDIGDPQVLADIGEELGGGAVGLDRLRVLGRLADGTDAAQVFRDYATAVRSGVNSVPFTVFGGKAAVAGAESPARLAAAMDRALAS